MAHHYSKPKARPSHELEVHRVCTLAEAEKIVFRDRHSIRYAIDAGHIAARQAGRVWIISEKSLKDHFPVKAPSRE